MPKKMPFWRTSFLVAGFLASDVVVARPDCELCDAGDGFYDKPSGMCLPKHVNDLTWVELPADRISSLKAYKNSLSTGFNDQSSHLAVTVYLYDRLEDSKAEDQREVKRAIAEILGSHSNAHLEMSGSGRFPVLDHAVDSLGGVFLWDEGTQSFASLLWIIPRGNRFVKIRATYLRPEGSETEAMKNALISIHKITDRICGL